MKFEDFLKKATQQLQKAGIGTARLDSLILIEDVLGVDRAILLAHPETNISSSQLAKLTKLLKRRGNHEPLAYVRGTTEFYGRNFVINTSVLEPRPESEAMIDLLKHYVKNGTFSTQPASHVTISDVGTGSGALGITAALEIPKSSVELLDISQKALEIAKINVDKFTLNITMLKSNLLMNSKQQSVVLLCNLPYVPDDYSINEAAQHEPKLAIFGGRDGLDLYCKLFKQLTLHTNKPLLILTEALPEQHQKLATIAAKTEYRLDMTDDFIQAFVPNN